MVAALATGGYLFLRRFDSDDPAVAWRNLSVARPRWWRSRYGGVRLLGLAAAGQVLALLGDHVGLTGWVGTGLVIAAVVVEATYLLGDERADPLSGFEEAVDAALATQNARTAAATGAAADGDVRTRGRT